MSNVMMMDFHDSESLNIKPIDFLIVKNIEEIPRDVKTLYWISFKPLPDLKCEIVDLSVILLCLLNGEENGIDKEPPKIPKILNVSERSDTSFCYIKDQIFEYVGDNPNGLNLEDFLTILSLSCYWVLINNSTQLEGYIFLMKRRVNFHRREMTNPVRFDTIDRLLDNLTLDKIYLPFTVSHRGNRGKVFEDSFLITLSVFNIFQNVAREDVAIIPAIHLMKSEDMDEALEYFCKIYDLGPLRDYNLCKIITKLLDLNNPSIKSETLDRISYRYNIPIGPTPLGYLDKKCSYLSNYKTLSNKLIVKWGKDYVKLLKKLHCHLPEQIVKEISLLFLDRSLEKNNLAVHLPNSLENIVNEFKDDKLDIEKILKSVSSFDQFLTVLARDYYVYSSGSHMILMSQLFGFQTKNVDDFINYLKRLLIKNNIPIYSDLPLYNEDEIAMTFFLEENENCYYPP